MSNTHYMTPIEITMALHYHYSTTDFRDGDFTAPIVREAIERFKDEGLIRARTALDRHTESMYIGTPRLKAYIDKLTTIPLPVQSWGYPK